MTSIGQQKKHYDYILVLQFIDLLQHLRKKCIIYLNQYDIECFTFVR